MTKEEFLELIRADRYDNIKFIEPMFGREAPSKSDVHIAFVTDDKKVELVWYINKKIYKHAVVNTGDVAADYDLAIGRAFRYFYGNYGYTELS